MADIARNTSTCWRAEDRRERAANEPNRVGMRMRKTSAIAAQTSTRAYLRVMVCSHARLEPAAQGHPPGLGGLRLGRAAVGEDALGEVPVCSLSRSAAVEVVVVIHGWPPVRSTRTRRRSASRTSSASWVRSSRREPLAADDEDAVADLDEVGGLDARRGARRRRGPRRLAMARRMSTRAPTSTAWVGSCSTRRSGSTESHLAKRTFCWLPPESSLTSVRGERVRMPRRRDRRPAPASSCQARPTYHGLPRRRRFGHGDVVAHAQLDGEPLDDRASPGTSATPARRQRRDVGTGRGRALPVAVVSDPARGATAPADELGHVPRSPIPGRPVSPTTSPARTAEREVVEAVGCAARRRPRSDLGRSVRSRSPTDHGVDGPAEHVPGEVVLGRDLRSAVPRPRPRRRAAR